MIWIYARKCSTLTNSFLHFIRIVLHPAAAAAYPNITGASNAQYRQPQAGGVRQQGQGGQGAQAAGIRNSARPITGQQQVQVSFCFAENQMKNGQFNTFNHIYPFRDDQCNQDLCHKPIKVDQPTTNTLLTCVIHQLKMLQSFHRPLQFKLYTSKVRFYSVSLCISLEKIMNSNR